MEPLPPPETYEKENRYMPWGILINHVLSIVIKRVPKHGEVIDLMCGPGYLTGKIAGKRGDLRLTGLDINGGFISYARRKYPFAKLIRADAIEWEPKTKYDLVLCTAGLHHLPYSKQAGFLKKVRRMLKPQGFCIIADPYIDDCHTETQRRLAAAKLGFEYIRATIKNNAPVDVVEAAVDIMHNDLAGDEYKNSIKRVVPLFRKIFKSVEIHKTWPKKKTEYGDYYIIAK